MQIKHFCIIFFFLAVIQSNFAQQIDKVIISGYGGQHDLDVQTAFQIGYASYNNTPFEGEVILYSYTLQTSFNYAVANNYDLIIRSTSGLSTGLRLAPDYPTVELVMPAGSNIFTQTFFGDVITSPVVITGTGIDSNQTGYKLEFYSIDPITETNASSFSNGFIAGQLAFISNILNISFDSARTLARVNGSENGNWDFYNGFGKIEINKIISNPLPVELTSFTAKVIGKSILLNWHTSTETNNFGFNIEREIFKPQSSVNKWETIGFVFGNGNSNLQRDYSFIDDDPDGFFQIKYRLKQIDIDGEIEYSKVISVKYSLNNFELYQNYPNPFNPSTTISYNIPETGRVVLTLYDILGQSIKKFVNEIKESGTHTINFDAIELNSGTYIYQIEFNGLTQSRKMTLIK